MREFELGIQLNGLAFDPAGNVIVAGRAPNGFPTTDGVVQPTLSSNYGGLIAKLNATGTSLIWSTYFGSSSLTIGATALAVDTKGNIVVAGYARANSLPIPGLPLSSSTYVARLSGDGKMIQDLYTGPDSSTGQALALTSTGTFVALGQSGSVWIETTATGPSLLGTTNAAGGQVSGQVAPSELISLYGVGIGPETALDGEVQNGVFKSALAGYQVLFDGIAAPLLYVGSTQINAIVPKAVLGRDATHIQIATPSGAIDGPTLQLRPTLPAVFRNSQTGLASALNQNGALNSPQNPANPGEVVTVFATGGGTVFWNDGFLVPANLALSSNVPVSVLARLFRAANPSDGLTSLEVQYAGDAPGLVAGVMQINFRLPDSFAPGGTFDFRLQVGEALGGGGSIAVRGLP